MFLFFGKDRDWLVSAIFTVVRKGGNQSVCRDQFKTWVFSGFPSGKTIRCVFVVVFLVYFFFPLGFEDELQLGNVLNKYLLSRN